MPAVDFSIFSFNFILFFFISFFFFRCEPPAARLVGVELNPGPAVTRSQTRAAPFLQSLTLYMCVDDEDREDEWDADYCEPRRVFATYLFTHLPGSNFCRVTRVESGEVRHFSVPIGDDDSVAYPFPQDFCVFFPREANTVTFYMNMDPLINHFATGGQLNSSYFIDSSGLAYINRDDQDEVDIRLF